MKNHLRLLPLLLSLLVLAPACAAPAYDAESSDEELVGEAEGAAFPMYNDPRPVKDALTAGALYWGQYMCLNLGTEQAPNYKRPKLVAGIWTLVSPTSVVNEVASWPAGALPVILPTLNFIAASVVWDEAASIAATGGDEGGVPDYAGIFYTAPGSQPYDESYRTAIAGTYPGNATVYFKLGDP